MIEDVFVRNFISLFTRELFVEALSQVKLTFTSTSSCMYLWLVLNFSRLNDDVRFASWLEPEKLSHQKAV